MQWFSDLLHFSFLFERSAIRCLKLAGVPLRSLFLLKYVDNSRQALVYIGRFQRCAAEWKILSLYEFELNAHGANTISEISTVACFHHYM